MPCFKNGFIEKGKILYLKALFAGNINRKIFFAQNGAALRLCRFALGLFL
jgi:hypothetical protein